jgi:hydrogenase expression/formation protein HypD
MGNKESTLKAKVKILADEIHRIATRKLTFMEVCGTHTMAIAQQGVKSLLPDNLQIVSGPGCPVCVTSASDIETAIELGNNDKFIVATFGDMIKVPGESVNLGTADNVKVIYSPLNALTLARENPDKSVILLGIGFETTAPLMAAAVKAAYKEGLTNFFLLSMHKLVPPALELLLSDPESQLDGFILPGHVSAITGKKYYDFLDKYPTTSVIAGFDPLDVMECLYLLTKNAMEKDYTVVNNYPRVVKDEGNPKAFNTMFEVFEPVDSSWRGIGTIPMSGLQLVKKYEKFDAMKVFSLEKREIPEPPGCLCGTILMGKAFPKDCKHFGNSCTPSFPIGPCMVSSEGTCAAWFKYQM